MVIVSLALVLLVKQYNWWYSQKEFAVLAVRFHLGHIFEMQNKCQLAEEAYETIIEMANVPSSVKANAYKQLGM